jgi:hypothetical protein
MDIELLINALDGNGKLNEAKYRDQLNQPSGPPEYKGLPTTTLNLRRFNEEEKNDFTELPFPRELTDHDQRLWSNGVDTLAWYTPWHFSLENWGIYIRSRGIEILAIKLHKAGIPWQVAPKHALSMLIEHELGHFKAEVLVSTHEISENRHLYISGSSRSKLIDPWSLVEEGLCSSFSFHLTSGFRAETRKVLDDAPIGYRQWYLHTKKNECVSWGELLGQYLSGEPLPWAYLNRNFTKKEYLRLRQITVILDGSNPDGSPAGLENSVFN